MVKRDDEKEVQHHILFPYTESNGIEEYYCFSALFLSGDSNYYLIQKGSQRFGIRIKMFMFGDIFLR